MINSTLSKLATAILNANGDLMGLVYISLPDDRKRQVDAILSNNGRIGFESTTDAHAVNRILLVGITANNQRLVLAEVAAPLGAFDVGTTLQ